MCKKIILMIFVLALVSTAYGDTPTVPTKTWDGQVGNQWVVGHPKRSLTVFHATAAATDLGRHPRLGNGIEAPDLGRAGPDVALRANRHAITAVRLVVDLVGEVGEVGPHQMAAV